MRTSMRPRSAGSSRISKLLLPLLTEAAISTASPLSGTGAFVAAVAVSVAADVVAGVASCGWIMPAVGAAASELSVGACAVAAAEVCPWADRAPADEDKAPAAAWVATASAAAFAVSGLAVPAGCTRLFWAVAVDESVADASAVPEAVSDAVVLDVGFAATGVGAATVLVKAAAVAAETLVDVAAGWLADAATVWPAAAVTATFAVAVAVVVAVAVDAVAVVLVAVVAFGSVSIWADAAACAEMACELAAIAAAAIASGAVAVPKVGRVAAGTMAETTGTGIATATGVGVVTDSPACCAWAVGSAVDVSSVVEVDLVLPALGGLDCRAPLLPDAPLALALLLSEGPEPLLL